MVVVLLLAWAWWPNRKQATTADAEPRPNALAPSPAADSETASAQPGDGSLEAVRFATNELRPGGSIPAPLAEAAALKREAVEVARQVVEAYPEAAISYALLGAAYYNIGNSSEAIGHLEKCLELDPAQAEAYDILAKIAFERGDLEGTVRLCREALARGPANPEVLNRLGRSLMDLGRTAEAIAALEQAAQLPGESSETHYLLGQAYLQSGEHVRAKGSFQRAVELLPDHTQAYFGLFTASMRLGERDEAQRYREKFQQLETVDRKSLTDRSAQQETLSGLPLVRETVARTFAGAAQIYRLQGDPRKAMEVSLKAARLDANNGLCRAALAAMCLKEDRLADGVRLFEQLANEQPESALNQLYLGRLRDRLGRFDETEQAYRRAQALAPERPEAYRELAEVYLRNDRKPAEARALAQRVVELAPDGTAFYLLAVACARTDDRAGARAAMERAVVLSPQDTRYAEFLRQLRDGP